MFGGTAAFPEHCRSSVTSRAFHCHQIASVYISFSFALLSPYVFSATITVHSSQHYFFFHHWTHISVMQKCLNFYELYLIWLNTTQASFGSFLFPLYFPNKMEWNFLTVVTDFAVWLLALLPNGLSWCYWTFSQAV